MLAKAFMLPREEVVTCTEWDCITKVMTDLLDQDVTAVVVLDYNDPKKAVGLITKTDITLAYHQGISSHQKAGLIMATNLKTISPATTRDSVAKMLEENHFHHAVVVDEDTGDFMGLVSAWHIVVECARDARGWPFHHAASAGQLHTPTTTTVSH